MLKNLLWRIACLCTLLLCNTQTFATHIMGGNLSYQYLGLDSTTGNYRYKLRLELFRLCDPGSSLLPVDMNIGVYQDDTLNPTGDKLQIFSGTLDLIIQQAITPPNGSDTCTFAPSVCVEEGIYEGIVSVPPNNTGYYFISDRCCRNNNIANLDVPGNTGQAYYAAAPPPTIVNNSPTFAVAPVPFVCNTDTASVLNQAFDPDGDLLVYTFATPYAGIADGGNPNPIPPGVYPWQIPNVTYAPTYSVTAPFGPGGSATIDNSTGLSQYYSPNQGFYVVAVEIEEFRNGILVGISRRDIQIIVIACPANPAPNLAPGSTQVTYTIEEGDTLCFNASFFDPNGDSLFITHTGDIFDTLLTTPAATFVDASGSGVATGQFCWYTSCDQGSTVPYQFSLIATDKGCPAKTTNIVYTINVVNTPKPLAVLGPDTLCGNANGILYTTPSQAGYTHVWSVINGTIVGSNTGDSIVVNFTGTGTATVIVETINSNNCATNSQTGLPIVLNAIPVANAGNDVSFCSGASASIGSASTPGYTYLWSPATGLSGANIASPNVTLTNTGTTPITNTYIVTVNNNGCIDTDTVQVIVNPSPIANAGLNVTTCSDTSVVIGSNPVAGYTYSWSPAAGLSSTTISNPTATITNSGTTPITQTYTVIVQNTFTCTATDDIDITINPIPVANAGTDLTICSGASASIGSPSVSGVTYSWSPATGLSSATISNPTISLTNTTGSPQTFSYVVTSSLSGCSNSDTIEVTVNPSPAANAGQNQLLCSGNSVQIGTTSTPGYTYSWTPGLGLNSTTISNPTVTLTNTGGSPITFIYILNVTLNGCTSRDTVQVTSSPAAAANAGADTIYCSGALVQIGSASQANYTYSWTPSGGLSSSSISNPTVTTINTGTSPITTTYTVTTNLFGCTATDDVTVTVNPSPTSNAGTNQFLCAGGTVQLGGTSTAGYTYIWTPANGLSSDTISDPTLTLSNTGSTPDTLLYIVTTTFGSCTTNDTVQVISAPAAAADAGNDVTYCSGSSAQIGSATQSNYIYSWSPSTGLSSATISDPVVNATNTTGAPVTVSYIVTSNLFGCIATDTVDVTINPLPVSNAGANQFLCAGGNVQLGTASTTGYTYSWSPATGLSGSTISNPILTLNNTGSTPDTLYYVVVTTFNGCTTTDSVQVISSPVPTAIAGSDVIYCSGSSATIGSASQTNYVYNWSPSTGLSSSTISSPTVTLTNTGTSPVTTTYILSTNLFGCLDDDTVLVTVKPNPLSEAGTDATLCGGDTLQIGAANTAGYLYTWTPSSGLSSTTISNPIVVIPNNTGSTVTYTYFVTTELNGCFTSDSITITVNPQPVVTASASPASLCAGDSTTLTATGATNYSWATSTAPGTVISTNASFSVNPSVTTTYIVTGSNGFNCSNVNTVTVTVNAIPVVQITAANDTICDGDSLTLTGNGASTYTWSVGGSVIGTGTSIVVSPSSNTTYVCTGTSSALCVDVDSISIYVNPAPTVAAIFGNGSVCPGVTGVQYWISNPDPNSSYTWVVTNGTIVSGQGTDTITVDWSTTPGIGIVTVVETTSFGCESNPVSYNVSINVLLTPVAPTGPTTLCANTAQGIIYTTLGTPGSTYNWFAQGGNVVSGNGTNSVNVDWTVSGPATVLLWYQETSITSVDTCFGSSDTLTITINPIPSTSAISGSLGVCISDSGTFSVTNTLGSSYNWTVNGGTLLSGNGTNSINAGNFVASGTAIITVTETNSLGCIGNVVNYSLNVNSLPNANAGSDVSVCIGQGVYLNATGGNIYLWSPSTGLSDPNSATPFANPTTATNYIVLVTDSNGCKNTDSVLVSVNSLPNVTLTSNSAICIGNSIQLNAGGGNSYQWYPGSTLSNDTINNPLANPTLTTTYTVVVTDGNTCVDSATVTITVNPLPIPFVNADTLICAGTNAQLFASGGVSYVWTPSATLNNANAQNPIASPNVPTTYLVTVTDANGCSADTSTTVNININPQADFSVNDGDLSDVTCAGYDGTLTNNSIDALTYLWIFPDGSTSTDINPQVQFNLSGSNIITLIATNNVCNDTAVIDFASTIIGDIFSNIPNIFTPNGDGLNDCFDLGNEVNLSECSRFEVFNRWGKKVFESSSSHPCWNGKKDGNGNDLSDGTYYIVVQVADKTYHGSVTLVR